MSTTLAPFGLVPAFHGTGGTIRLTKYSVLSTYASGILGNQPIKIGTDGTIQAAAIDDRFVGSFAGVQYVDVNGKAIFSPQWVAATVGTQIECDISWDPWIIYDIQANATLDVSSIGSQYKYTTITAGSTTTGLSAVALDAVTGAQTNAALQIVGLTPGPNNAWGDTYPIVQVRISQHQFVADIAQF